MNRNVVRSARAGAKQGARLTINHSAGHEVGYGYARASSQRMTMHAVRIVIDIQEIMLSPVISLLLF
ncbi:hypothetical protein ACQV2B_05355 [Pantoea allii]|uniref:hypothetical protein n=1 Tax=Pantoea allii TaxID=574096 RepID=UPI003D30FD2A